MHGEDGSLEHARKRRAASQRIRNNASAPHTALASLQQTAVPASPGHPQPPQKFKLEAAQLLKTHVA